jgi:GNAT superfamily N-acetyltransferase
MITIREATSADAPALAELRWEFRSPRGTRTETHDAFVQRCGAWMGAELESGAWRAWVACSDGQIVGQLWMRIIQKIPNPTGERERHAYISNVYVKPASRGGVGAQLLESAIAWARAHDVDHVLLWPTERSRTLYARYGFGATDSFLALKCD